MPRKKKLNDASPEEIEAVFLQEDPSLGKVEKKMSVPVFREVPSTEKVVFLNNRDPGVALEFHYHSRSHPLKRYTLMHGHQYDLPIEIIMHLEGENPTDPWACHRRTYGTRTDHEGRTGPSITGYVPYFQCKRVRRVA